MAGVLGIRNLQKRLLYVVNRRFISTSKKNSDTATATADTQTDKIVTSKNWVSYGFDKKSYSQDRRAMHGVFFTSITLCIVGIAYILAYVPDYNLRDWSQREAYLELRRREALGLPRIDPNLIDPSTIDLPSDEELGDTEIII